mmetsp:Transcript_27306/g.89405  ORF Transcript_27306/g.89405 Transcript_27306/m.89405 type:complete len:564 (+) Transcript_27306:411-2102(+)
MKTPGPMHRRFCAGVIYDTVRGSSHAEVGDGAVVLLLLVLLLLCENGRHLRVRLVHLLRLLRVQRRGLLRRRLRLEHAQIRERERRDQSRALDRRARTQRVLPRNLFDGDAIKGGGRRRGGFGGELLVVCDELLRDVCQLLGHNLLAADGDDDLPELLEVLVASLEAEAELLVVTLERLAVLHEHRALRVRALLALLRALFALSQAVVLLLERRELRLGRLRAPLRHPRRNYCRCQRRPRSRRRRRLLVQGLCRHLRSRGPCRIHAHRRRRRLRGSARRHVVLLLHSTQELAKGGAPRDDLLKDGGEDVEAARARRMHFVRDFLLERLESLAQRHLEVNHIGAERRALRCGGGRRRALARGVAPAVDARLWHGIELFPHEPRRNARHDRAPATAGARARRVRARRGIRHRKLHLPRLWAVHLDVALAVSVVRRRRPKHAAAILLALARRQEGRWSSLLAVDGRRGRRTLREVVPRRLAREARARASLLLRAAAPPRDCVLLRRPRPQHAVRHHLRRLGPQAVARRQSALRPRAVPAPRVRRRRCRHRPRHPDGTALRRILGRD